MPLNEKIRRMVSNANARLGGFGAKIDAAAGMQNPNLIGRDAHVGQLGAPEILDHPDEHYIRLFNVFESNHTGLEAKSAQIFIKGSLKLALDQHKKSVRNLATLQPNQDRAMVYEKAVEVIDGKLDQYARGGNWALFAMAQLLALELEGMNPDQISRPNEFFNEFKGYFTFGQSTEAAFKPVRDHYARQYRIEETADPNNEHSKDKVINKLETYTTGQLKIITDRNKGTGNEMDASEIAVRRMRNLLENFQGEAWANPVYYIANGRVKKLVKEKLKNEERPPALTALKEVYEDACEITDKPHAAHIVKLIGNPGTKPEAMRQLKEDIETAIGVIADPNVGKGKEYDLYESAKGTIQTLQTAFAKTDYRLKAEFTENVVSEAKAVLETNKAAEETILEDSASESDTVAVKERKPVVAEFTTEQAQEIKKIAVTAYNSNAADVAKADYETVKAGGDKRKKFIDAQLAQIANPKTGAGASEEYDLHEIASGRIKGVLTTRTGKQEDPGQSAAYFDACIAEAVEILKDDKAGELQPKGRKLNTVQISAIADAVKGAYDANKTAITESDLAYASRDATAFQRFVQTQIKVITDENTGPRGVQSDLSAVAAERVNHVINSVKSAKLSQSAIDGVRKMEPHKQYVTDEWLYDSLVAADKSIRTAAALSRNPNERHILSGILSNVYEKFAEGYAEVIADRIKTEAHPVTADIEGPTSRAALDFHQFYLSSYSDPVTGYKGSFGLHDKLDEIKAAVEKKFAVLPLKDGQDSISLEVPQINPEAIQHYMIAALEIYWPAIADAEAGTTGSVPLGVSFELTKQTIALMVDNPLAEVLWNQKDGQTARKNLTIEPVLKHGKDMLVSFADNQQGGVYEQFYHLLAHSGEDKTITPEQRRLIQIYMTALTHHAMETGNIGEFYQRFFGAMETLDQRLMEENGLNWNNFRDFILTAIGLVSPRSLVNLGAQQEFRKMQRSGMAATVAAKMAAREARTASPTDDGRAFAIAAAKTGKLLYDLVPQFPMKTELAEKLDKLFEDDLNRTISLARKLWGFGSPEGLASSADGTQRGYLWTFMPQRDQEFAYLLPPDYIPDPKHPDIKISWQDSADTLNNLLFTMVLGSRGMLVDPASVFGEENNQEFAGELIWLWMDMLRFDGGDEEALKSQPVEMFGNVSVRRRMLNVITDILTSDRIPTDPKQPIPFSWQMAKEAVEVFLPFWPPEDQNYFISELTTKILRFDAPIAKRADFGDFLTALSRQRPGPYPRPAGEEGKYHENLRKGLIDMANILLVNYWDLTNTTNPRYLGAGLLNAQDPHVKIFSENTADVIDNMTLDEDKLPAQLIKFTLECGTYADKRALAASLDFEFTSEVAHLAGLQTPPKPKGRLIAAARSFQESFGQDLDNTGKALFDMVLKAAKLTEDDTAKAPELPNGVSDAIETVIKDIGTLLPKRTELVRRSQRTGTPNVAILSDDLPVIKLLDNQLTAIPADKAMDAIAAMAADTNASHAGGASTPDQASGIIFDASRRYGTDSMGIGILAASFSRLAEKGQIAQSLAQAIGVVADARKTELVLAEQAAVRTGDIEVMRARAAVYQAAMESIKANMSNARAREAQLHQLEMLQDHVASETALKAFIARSLTHEDLITIGKDIEQDKLDQTRRIIKLRLEKRNAQLDEMQEAIALYRKQLRLLSSDYRTSVEGTMNVIREAKHEYSEWIMQQLGGESKPIAYRRALLKALARIRWDKASEGGDPIQLTIGEADLVRVIAFYEGISLSELQSLTKLLDVVPNNILGIPNTEAAAANEMAVAERATS